MKAQFKNPYRKGDGTFGFIYTLTGTPEELAAYKKAQGQFYAEDGGKPLLFARDFGGHKCSVIEHTNKEGEIRFYLDTAMMDILQDTERKRGWNIARMYAMPGQQGAVVGGDDDENDQPAPPVPAKNIRTKK